MFNLVKGPRSQKGASGPLCGNVIKVKWATFWLIAWYTNKKPIYDIYCVLMIINCLIVCNIFVLN